LGRDLTYNVTRASVAFDWRPAAAYSTRGGYYRASFEHNSEADGQPYSFSSQEYEVVQLVPLVKEQFVFAARGLVTLTDTNGNNAVPVMLAPYLGSGNTLRGFANRRFTDRNRALVTGEYRWRPSRYLDMAMFLDAGQVSPDRHFHADAFDVAVGIGARFHGPNFNALRIEAARGREGLRLVISGAQPF
jgi:outer membrane protein assembly factor BamA